MIRNTTREGRCMCGDIRFEILGDPYLVEFCHCTSCRKSVGAPVMAWVGISRAYFRFVHGTPKSYLSSPGVERGFCGNCGTSISITSTAYPDEVYVSDAAIDDASSFPPEVHIWRSQSLPWLEINESLPRYLKFKSDGEMEPSSR
jgi:hypothetical protein